MKLALKTLKLLKERLCMLFSNMRLKEVVMKELVGEMTAIQ